MPKSPTPTKPAIKTSKPTPKPGRIKIICISDTHNAQPHLPPGDILLHAGDLTQTGNIPKLQAQLNWLNSQPHQHKILIAGNHDKVLDADFIANNPQRDFGGSVKDLQWGNVVYLKENSVVLKVGKSKKGVKIWGSPMTPKADGGGFRYHPKTNIWKDRIPRDTDIVLVHGPPRGYVDGGGKGCKFLLEELRSVRPRLVVCGHIHEGSGREKIVWKKDESRKWWMGLFGGGGKGKGRRETEIVNAAVGVGSGTKEAVTVYL
jgi:calcineurin-like phosphoesterase family protein